MIIKNLFLSNFRNHKNLSLDFHKRLIFFIGENGEGKTNILESIHMFATMKSFRSNTDEEVTGWGDDFYYIKINLSKDEISKEIEIGFSKGKEKKKKIKINQEELKKKTDLIGEMKSVMFSPVDLKILEGGPAERRKFIDSFLSYTNRSYIEYLLEYNKILKQRNSLLKTGRTSNRELLPWDKMMSDRGTNIMNHRQESIYKLNELYKSNLSNLSGNKDQMEIQYFPSITDSKNYLEELQSKIHLDTKLGYTTKGIHRDDLFIGRDGNDITTFGSQGQKRSTVISLRTAQFQYVQSEQGESPILLIDDVIRELDVKRREYFVNLLMNCGQAFFTTTDLEGIRDYVGALSESIQVFEVRAGIVREIYI